VRRLDKSIADEKERLARAEKMLADYQEQLGKPFEHEARLKELLVKQAQLNALLDLDKGERQVPPAAEDNAEPPGDDASSPAKVSTGPSRKIWRRDDGRRAG
jgi:hypothetical protein